MTRLLLLLAGVGGAVGLAASVLAQGGGPPPVRPGKPVETAPAPKPHRTGELECRNCHQGSHHGVVSMYLGIGGRGTAMIPSHMVQVRVECAACHVAPKEAEGPARIIGQTFRPSEEACLGCHGEKYRGMLGRWAATLTKMRETLAPKLAAAPAALAAADPKNAKHARARRLIDDAEFNVQFVALGKGVHNVFYAADLLKLSNGWLDEAMALLGKAPVKTDDVLVRGGYCGVLCHEQAGVKLKEVVVFGKQPIPHSRHVTELGATCTGCHSAEVHKAMTAKAATCSSCHHSPQNDRCEACHRAQAAFYRGTVKTDLAKVEPSVMAEAVPCVGCHDFTGKHSRQAVGQKCVGCHEAPYLALLSEWTSGFDKDASRAASALKRAEVAQSIARRAGRVTTDADRLVKDARTALSLVAKARGAHNPAVADALLETVRRKAEAALPQLSPR